MRNSLIIGTGLLANVLSQTPEECAASGRARAELVWRNHLTGLEKLGSVSL